MRRSTRRQARADPATRTIPRHCTARAAYHAAVGGDLGRTQPGSPGSHPAATGPPGSIRTASHIRADRTGRGGGDGRPGAGRGTGFFVDRNTVLTNAHVVEGASSVSLHTANGTARARVASVADDYDLAVLKIDGATAPHAMLPLAATPAARVGQEVIAIGFALGLLENTVTRGIISGIRQVGGIMFLQTDAAINPGNSGGPLLDTSGRVLGVTTLKFGVQAESLGFAVAAEHARPLLAGGRPHGRRVTRLVRVAPAGAAPHAQPDLRRRQASRGRHAGLRAAGRRHRATGGANRSLLGTIQDDLPERAAPRAIRSALVQPVRGDRDGRSGQAAMRVVDG